MGLRADSPSDLGGLRARRAKAKMVPVHCCEVLPPGLAELDLVMSESGHLLLPISEFARVARRVSTNSDSANSVAPKRALAHAQWAA